MGIFWIGCDVNLKWSKHIPASKKNGQCIKTKQARKKNDIGIANMSCSKTSVWVPSPQWPPITMPSSYPAQLVMGIWHERPRPRHPRIGHLPPFMPPYCVPPPMPLTTATRAQSAIALNGVASLCHQIRLRIEEEGGRCREVADWDVSWWHDGRARVWVRRKSRCNCAWDRGERWGDGCPEQERRWDRGGVDDLLTHERGGVGRSSRCTGVNSFFY